MAVKKYAKADIKVLQSCPILRDFFTLFQIFYSVIAGTYTRLRVTDIYLNVRTHNCCLEFSKEANNYQLQDGARLTISLSHIFMKYVELSISRSNMHHHSWKQIFITKSKLNVISLSVL